MFGWVKPIFKHRGRSEDPTNYRPISLLPARGKILDNIQAKRFVTICWKMNFSQIASSDFYLIDLRLLN